MTAAQVLNRIPLEDYAPLLGKPEIDEMRALARPLRGKAVQMVNSTAVGGGVAEILNLQPRGGYGSQNTGARGCGVAPFSHPVSRAKQRAPRSRFENLCKKDIEADFRVTP